MEIQGAGRNYDAYVRNLNSQMAAGEITQEEAEELKADFINEQQAEIEERYNELADTNPEALQAVITEINNMDVTKSKDVSDNQVLNKFDIDGDGKLDKTEQSNLRVTSKLNEIYSNEAVISKFDIDGSGTLNDKEKTALKAYITAFSDNGTITEDALDNALEYLSSSGGAGEEEEDGTAETIASLNDKIEDLSEQIAALQEAQNAQLMPEEGVNTPNTEEALEEIDVNTADAANTSADISRLSSQASAAANVMKNISSANKAAETAKANAKSIINPPADGSGYKNEELQPLKDKMDSSYTAYNDKMNELGVNSDKVNKAQSDVDEAQGAVDENSLKIIDQEDTVSMKTQAAAAAQASFNAAAAALNAANEIDEDDEGRDAAISAARAAKASAQQALNEAKQEEQDAKDELENLKNEQTKLEKTLADAKQALAEAQNEVNGDNEELQNLSKEYNDARDAYYTKRDELAKEQQTEMKNQRQNAADVFTSDDMKRALGMNLE